MKPVLGLRIGQQLRMTPQLQQAIRLLQLSSIDLRAEIQSMLQTNVFLETEEDQHTEQEEELTEELNHWGTTHSRPFDNDAIEKLSTCPFSLRDYLFWQMQLTPFTENDRLIAAAIIDAINEDGFLTCSLEEIATTLPPSMDVKLEEVTVVLHRIQQFDPIGVGARSLEECLRLQIDHLPSSTPWHHHAQLLITHYLLLLGKHDYTTLQRRLGLRPEELQEVIQLIQTLHPRPGTQISYETPEYILPDAFVFKRKNEWIVELNAQSTLPLTINHYYASMLRSHNAKKPADYSMMKQQLQEAKWFLHSIATRNETLLKVIQSIVRHQIDFFEKGEHYMKPLILQDIAHDLNMHGSTISRITTQKYLHTPRGMVELKYFFSNHNTKDPINDYSSTAIRALIKSLIGNEDGKKPLSDNKIAVLLASQGIPIARRTVAKYREEMNIVASNERKHL